jgi:hypothetical protein
MKSENKNRRLRGRLPQTQTASLGNTFITGL